MKLLTICVLALASINLNAQGIESVIKLGSAPLKSFENIVVYNLPQSTIEIVVKISENQFFAGPYASFAEDFLGIKNTKIDNSISYNIDSIEIKSIQEIDPQQYYAIKTSKHFNTANFLAFQNEGLICNPSILTFKRNNEIQKKHNNLTFKDLSKENFYTESADTFYKTILKDTVFVRIPIIKSKTEAKTIRDKAREAADVIIKVRQRKYDLLMSEEGDLPEVKSLKLAFGELDNLENKYLSLFIGIEYKQSKTSSFYVTPQKEEEQIALFNFSTNKGITEESEENSSKITLNIKKENNTQALLNNFNNLQSTGSNQILYRLPDIGNVKLLKNDKVILSQKLSVYQYGVVVPSAVNW